MKHRGYIKMLSLILCVSMLLQINSVSVIAATNRNYSPNQLEHTQSSSVQPAVDNTEADINQQFVIGEEEQLRTESGKHFRLSDGSFVSVSYGMPIHYSDANGKWYDIDNTLQLINTYNNAAVYTATNGSTAISFAKDLSLGQLFTSEYHEKTVTMSLIDAEECTQNVEPETDPIVTEPSISNEIPTVPSQTENISQNNETTLPDTTPSTDAPEAETHVISSDETTVVDVTITPSKNEKIQMNLLYRQLK